jgi:hypothetical protein
VRDNCLPSELLDEDFLRWVAEHATAEERAKYGPLLKRMALEVNYEQWIKTLFPGYATSPLAEHHHELWRWVWAIEKGLQPEAFVAIWPRGGAKSTTAELACVALGARGKRRYGWYICRTQEQADDHVANVGSMLESKTIEQTYPELGEKLVGKFGNAKGWRRNRLRTASGFTLDAVGLDTASRGGKLEDQRPDFIILDDIDDEKDSPKVTRKVIQTITKGILPAGAEDVAILAIQNLIHPNGVFARIVIGVADYLRRRVLSGPIKALKGFAYKQNPDGTYTITAGDPTWEGFGVSRCEDMLNEIGPKAFREECQHEVTRVEGAMWKREQIDGNRVAEHPDPKRVVVAVDPSGGDGEDNDEQGIMVVGLGVDGIAYVLEDLTCKLSPRGWAGRAIAGYNKYSADLVVGERNFGGDMVRGTVLAIDSKVKYDDVKASRGKVARAEPVAAPYGVPERPDEWHLSRVRHVGHWLSLKKNSPPGPMWPGGRQTA